MFKISIKRARSKDRTHACEHSKECAKKSSPKEQTAFFSAILSMLFWVLMRAWKIALILVSRRLRWAQKMCGSRLKKKERTTGPVRSCDESVNPEFGVRYFGIFFPNFRYQYFGKNLKLRYRYSVFGISVLVLKKNKNKLFRRSKGHKKAF